MMKSAYGRMSRGEALARLLEREAKDSKRKKKGKKGKMK
jgi:hypothetical protein